MCCIAKIKIIFSTVEMWSPTKPLVISHSLDEYSRPVYHILPDDKICSFVENLASIRNLPLEIFVQIKTHLFRGLRRKQI